MGSIFESGEPSMIRGFSVSLTPIAAWPLVLGASLAVLWLTVWAYRKRLRGAAGFWRHAALGLRLAALALCFLAALRPSVILKEKKRQASSLVFIVDTSTSMRIGDEVGGKTRSEVALAVLEQARQASKGLEKDLDVKVYGFDRTLSEPKDGALPPPKGNETALGAAMLEVQKRQEGTGKRLARLVVISDFTSNAGLNPLIAAERLRGQGVPVSTVGVGTENAGAQSRDLAVRDLIANPTVFVKNELVVKGSLIARGFANQWLDVELLVEGQDAPVAKMQVKAPEDAQVIPLAGLKYIPQTHGEKKITLRVVKRDGELVESNNEVSTFVTVLSGGLNVLFLQGPNLTFDYRFLMRAIGRSPDILVEGALLHKPAEDGKGEIDDAEFTPGRYNVYILSDIAANFFTRAQHKLLADAVRKGAGFMMLGGHSSFGAGGWADTEIAGILPTAIHPGDGQLEPEGGVKFVPSNLGLDGYLLQVGPTRAESARIWDTMFPIQGTNHLGDPKLGATILGTTPAPNPEPIMLGMPVGDLGRVLAFGGETWVWARASEEGRLAHRRFWRQVIFWLAHKENDSDDHVSLTLEKRRIAVGDKLDLKVAAHDAKGNAITGVVYEGKVERERPTPATSPLEIPEQGDMGRGSIYATENVGLPSEYTVSVIARKDGKEIGRDSARFLVYQDDRELENPSADLKLAREIATMTGGELVTPERLANHLKGLDRSTFTEYLSPTEYKVWDNWPFLLLFTFLLTLEWWLRKRHGWV